MAVIRRAGFWLVLIPCSIVLVIFALANRQRVILSLDPFSANATGLELPLFLVVFAVLGFGALIGAFLTWNAQRPWRIAARKSEKEIAALRSQIVQIKATPIVAPPPEAWQILPPL